MALSSPADRSSHNNTASPITDHLSAKQNDCDTFLKLLSSDAPIMIFRGRFRYRFFLSKLADSDFDTDLFSFKQPTRNNERF